MLAEHDLRMELKFSQKLLTRQEIRRVTVNLYGVTSTLNVYVFLCINL